MYQRPNVFELGTVRELVRGGDLGPWTDCDFLTCSAQPSVACLTGDLQDGFFLFVSGLCVVP